MFFLFYNMLINLVLLFPWWNSMLNNNSNSHMPANQLLIYYWYNLFQNDRTVFFHSPCPAIAKHWNGRCVTNLLKWKYIFRVRERACECHPVNKTEVPPNFTIVSISPCCRPEWGPILSHPRPTNFSRSGILYHVKWLNVVWSLYGTYLIFWLVSGSIPYLHGEQLI